MEYTLDNILLCEDEETGEQKFAFEGMGYEQLRSIRSGLEPWIRKGNWVEAICLSLDDMMDDVQCCLGYMDESLKEFITGDWDECKAIL